jgi:fumarate reductase subunit D
MARSIEPLWWALFSAGGMLAALFLPVLIVITGVLAPSGVVPDEALAYGRVYPLLAQPAVKLGLFALLALPLFHWAHRFLYTLAELGLRRWKRTLAVLCYGSAALGALAAAVVLIRL